MGMYRAQIDRGANMVSPAGPGDMVLTQTQVVNITTAGSGAFTAAGMLAGAINRTGPVAGYADTLETADNLMAAAPHLSIGDTFEFYFLNGAAFANTVAVAEGAELVGANTAVAASLVRRYMVTVLANRRRQIYNVTTTNASAVLSGMTQAQVETLQSGMGVTGTNIPASTTIIGVNAYAGTVTMSATATAGGSVAGTFFPRYNVRGLFSATA